MTTLRRKKYSLALHYGAAMGCLLLAIFFVAHPSILTCVFLISFAAGIGYYSYVNVGPPLRDIRRTAEKMAKGNFEGRLPEYSVLEIFKLSVVMNKLGTQLKHLEEVRPDFVANVSHELKTPITSIKGFVETLL